MTSRTSRRVRNGFLASAAVLLVGAVVFYFAYPTVWLDERLARLARGTWLEDVAWRQLYRRHGGPLARDILNGRYGPGTPITDLTAVYRVGTPRYYGRFVDYPFPSSSVTVVTLDGVLVRADVDGLVLYQSLWPDEEWERQLAHTAVIDGVRQRDRSRKALRGLVGFGAAADPRPRLDPFGPPGG